MSKVIFEFDDEENRWDVSLCTYRHKLAKMLFDLADYARQLRRYEERESIPTEEVEEKISDLIYDWNFISDM